MFTKLRPKSVLNVSQAHSQWKYSLIIVMHYSDVLLILQVSKRDSEE